MCTNFTFSVFDFKELRNERKRGNVEVTLIWTWIDIITRISLASSLLNLPMITKLENY